MPRNKNKNKIKTNDNNNNNNKKVVKDLGDSGDGGSYVSDRCFICDDPAVIRCEKYDKVGYCSEGALILH